jgi:hypothetical protein
MLGGHLRSHKQLRATNSMRGVSTDARRRTAATGLGRSPGSRATTWRRSCVLPDPASPHTSLPAVTTDSTCRSRPLPRPRSRHTLAHVAAALGSSRHYLTERQGNPPRRTRSRAATPVRRMLRPASRLRRAVVGVGTACVPAARHCASSASISLLRGLQLSWPGRLILPPRVRIPARQHSARGAAARAAAAQTPSAAPASRSHLPAPHSRFSPADSPVVYSSRVAEERALGGDCLAQP